MNKTKIEWALNPDGTPGYTWNPITGCNNQVDGLCGGTFPCYAYRLANTRLRERYLANKNTATRNYDEDSYPFYPRFEESKMGQSLTNSWRVAPKGIFVCDMSDLFGIGVPEEWTRRVLAKISQGQYQFHRFYLLTKQPQNLIKFSPFPDNAWVGVTAIDNEMASKALFYLKDIKAKVKYLSIEPLLEAIYMSFNSNEIQQVIIGAQTKPTVMPKIEWVREIVKACDKAGIPVFLKNNLKPLLPPEVSTFYSVYVNVLEDEPAKDPILKQELPK